MRGRENPVMARKVRGPKMRLTGFPVLEPLCNAFATICATEARKDLRTDVEVTVRGYEALRHGVYLQDLPQVSAIYLLAFGKTGGGGLIRAETGLLNRIIDLSLGTSDAPELAVEDRPLTSIDIAIYRRFVDVVATAFDAAIVEICGRSAIGRATSVRFVQQPGMVRIAPDRAEVFSVRLGFRIGADAETSELDLVIPVATLAPLKDDLARSAATDDEMAAEWEDAMRERVMGLTLGTDCIVDLGFFSVGELSRLEQGALIELPHDATNAIELRVPTVGGDVAFARARLGASGRHKAVRLVDDPDTDFLRPLRAMLDEAAP